MAGPGIGKSTFAANLFSTMKQLEYKVELITEYAKDCVYEQQFNILNNDQLFVLANQNRRIQRIEESNEDIDYVITDSPLLLSKIFANKNNVKHNYLSFQDFCVDLFASYDNINLILNRDNISYHTEGRVETYIEALKIDELILTELRKWNFDYKLVTDRNLNSDNIKEYLTI